MYVLHALFTEAGCWELWAEDSGRPQVATTLSHRSPLIPSVNDVRVCLKVLHLM